MDMNGTNRVRVGNGSGGAENTVNPSEIMFLRCNLQECKDMRIVLALPGGAPSSSICYKPGYRHFCEKLKRTIAWLFAKEN